MNRRTFVKSLPALTVLAGTASAIAQAAPGSPRELEPISLLKPQNDGGKSVLAALWQRKTNRSISSAPLPPQLLSNLLWAAWG